MAEDFDPDEFESMDNEQVLDRFSERPKEFVSMVARQVRKGIEAENAQKAQEHNVVKTYEEFRNLYPDFEQRWESGELKEFMDSHPGHNALSAYLSLSQDVRIKKAVSQTLKEKGLIGLDNTRENGGTTKVLAERLRARRAAGGGKGLPMESSDTGGLVHTLERG